MNSIGWLIVAQFSNSLLAKNAESPWVSCYFCWMGNHIENQVCLIDDLEVKAPPFVNAGLPPVAGLGVFSSMQ